MIDKLNNTPLYRRKPLIKLHVCQIEKIVFHSIFFCYKPSKKENFLLFALGRT